MRTTYQTNRRPHPGAGLPPRQQPDPVRAFGDGLYPNAEPPATPEPPATGPDTPASAGPSGPLKVRVKLYGTLGGCRAELEAEVTTRQLRNLVPGLEARGFQPEAPPLTFQLTADGSPICPKHGCAMKEREKQGDSWWSHTVEGPRGEKLYCRGYAGPESPGYTL